MEDKPEKIDDNIDEKLVNIQQMSRIIVDSGNFVKNLTKKERKLYDEIQTRLKTDTLGRLSDTEYEGLAKISYFCDKFEDYFRDKTIGDIDASLFDLYRKMKTELVRSLKDYREGSKVTPPSIVQIQKYLVQIKGTDKDISKLKFDPTLLEAVDADAVILEDEDEENGDAVQQ